MNYNQLLGIHLENNINTLVLQLLGNVREELRDKHLFQMSGKRMYIDVCPAYRYMYT